MRKSRSTAPESCFPTNSLIGLSQPFVIGGSPTSAMIYFEDVDAVAERAVSAGAKVLQPVADQFYGDRSCKLQDPSGHTWMFATHKEDVPPDELKRRAEAMFGGGG
jgi:PhnB protein